MSSRPVMVITGSSRGLGRALSEYYLARDFFVAGCSREDATVNSSHYCHFRVDVGDETQAQGFVRDVRRQCGRIDVLISNAGIVMANQLLMSTSGEDLEKMIRTNFSGSYMMCREVSRVMVAQKFGRIITISSMAAGLHQVGTSGYAATKAAVVEMTKILAKEVAEYGVTCNVVAPSVFPTAAVAALGEKTVAAIPEKLTIKRELTIDEIGHVISFLIAREGGAITGQVIHMGLVC